MHLQAHSRAFNTMTRVTAFCSHNITGSIYTMYRFLTSSRNKVVPSIGALCIASISTSWAWHYHTYAVGKFWAELHYNFIIIGNKHTSWEAGAIWPPAELVLRIRFTSNCSLSLPSFFKET